MMIEQIRFIFLVQAAQEESFVVHLFFHLFHFASGCSYVCRFPVAESSELLEEVQALKDIPSPHFEPDSIFLLTKVPVS